MNFVYILEGQLKYESIEYESHLTFELYNKNETFKEEYNTDSSLVYFLASDVEMSISLDMNDSKVYFSTDKEFEVLLSGKDGIEREVKTKDYIDITEDLIKLSIPSIEFSFLFNTKEDPTKGKDVPEPFDLKWILNQNRNKIKMLISVIVILIIIVVFLNRGGVQTNKIVFFNNQTELMKANLSALDSSDVLVKSELKLRVEKLLDEIGIKYIRFDLNEKNEKINLILFVFEKNNDDLEKALGLGEVFWLNDVVFQALDPKNMYEDFNSIAGKYDLQKQDVFNRDLTHQLIIVNLTNNNLKYMSIQRDTKVFIDRWGKNYIEFNINLIQKKEMTFDFIMTNGTEKIIKSGNEYFFN